MDKRQLNNRAVPLTIPAIVDGVDTTLTLPVTIPGTVIGTDGSETLYGKDGTATNTVAIPSGQTITINKSESFAANSTGMNGSASASTTAVLSTTGSSGAQMTNTAATTALSHTITSLTSNRTATGTTGVLYPGNTFVYTTGSPPTIVTSHISAGKGGMQPGESAGLAIGLFIAGALIAGLFAFLLFSRRNKRTAAQNAQYEPATYTDEHHLKHPTTIAAVPVGAIGAASIVENNLPQPKEDNAIIGDLSRIKSRIEGHVDSYYHTARTNNKAVAQALSDALGTAFPISIAKLQELLSNPRKCPALLRAALAWIIISRIDFKSEPSETFLPAHLAGATRDLTSSRMDESTRVAFLSKWRQITAALSGNTFLQEIPADDARLANIKGALALADTFLRPYAKDADHDKRLFNLEEIMKRAARFGFLLFSQPSSFQFDWADSGSGLVVFPGLLQASDDNGKPLASPRPFGQKEVVPI